MELLLFLLFIRVDLTWTSDFTPVKLSIFGFIVYMVMPASCSN
jgi:hypothetical protein